QNKQQQTMASISQLVLITFLLCITTVSQAQTSAKPKALILPISKDASTLQYTTYLGMGTPPVQKKVVVDLAEKHLWIDCESGYESSTYKPGYCGSAACSVSKADCVSFCPTPPKPGCNNNTCRVLIENSVRGSAGIAEVALDTISLHSTDGSKAGKTVQVPNFIFACTDIFGLDELAKGAQGMLGLSRHQIALPPQLSSAFGGSFRKKFAICLPSTPKSDGVMFFGDSPYVFYPGYNTSKAIDVSKRITGYTRLYPNYDRTASPRLRGPLLPGYFVKVTSILVNKKPIPLNTTLLDFHITGQGGSTISTVKPYTILDSSIYKSLVQAFDEEMASSKVAKVAPVAPFKDCYSTKNMLMSGLGLVVPDITFVFENKKDLYWEMFGANSMVEINRDVACLAFVDGGPVGDFYPALETAIEFGTHQLQDYLVQFDIASSRVGFTSSLLLDELVLITFLLCITTVSQAQTSAKPKALILPISKDASTLQYTTYLGMGTPPVQKKVVVDLAEKHLWIDCESGYESSTYKPGYCGTAACSVAKAECVSFCPTPPKPGCNNNTCRVLIENSVRGTAGLVEVALDTISLQSTDGSKAGKTVQVPNFIFACTDIFALDELAKGAQGMLGLSRYQVALPPQLSSAFGGSFRRKFAICLPSTPKSDGVMLFGDSPYVFYPSYDTSKAIDVSKRITGYTRLYTNYQRTASPRVQGAVLPGYFVKVTSVLVNKKPIPLNTTLLEFQRTGIGGSTITTVKPYTILDSSIYKSLVQAFDKEMATSKAAKVAPVAPFNDCYSTKNMGMSPLGLAVPDVTFVFENKKDVYWEMFGANSMVEINNDVACLAFVDGGPVGPTLEAAIEFGAHQLQDNLVQFDIASSRVGFTSSLLLAALVLICFLLCFTTLSQAQPTSPKPKALILPVSKDASTLQYTTHLGMGTPPVQKKVVVDLAGKHLWIDCDSGYESSTYKPGYCGSAACSVSKAYCVSCFFAPSKPGCHNNTCRVQTLNSIKGSNGIDEVALDTISLHSTDGSKASKNVQVPNFIFACSAARYLWGLATGAQGILGLSRYQVALPPQLSSAFGGSFRRNFAICLPSTPKSNGVMFFGDSPYMFYPSYDTSMSIDVSKRITGYTRLYTNYERTASPRVQGAVLPGYFVKVTSVLVDKKPIPLNTTLLEFQRTGIGGSTISTVKPYTILDSSIYKSLVQAFDKEMATSKVDKVAPVAPFKDCYSTTNMAMSPLGLGVPDITFVFENKKDVYWEMFGANSMVEVNHDVACLAFVDGGPVGDFYPALEAAIEFGTHQLQDNLVQFDIASSRVGFTSSLLLAAVECSNFKF
ncbi:hypothetical protein Tsubulata_043092, partial [Turnera subulata]